MADIGGNIPRAGSIDNATDKDALFLQVFSGEVLTAFEEANVMRDLHTVRTISEGKSASFPVTGIASAAYLTAGEDILTGSNHLSKIKHSERVITVDDLLVSSTFIADIDSLRNHFDLRSIYSKELGKALAKRFDLAVMKTLVAGAGQTANPTDQPDGISITGFGAIASATGAKVIDALVSMAEKLDENDVPDDGDRFAVLPPSLYYLLVSDATGNIALNKDYGGVGSIAEGNVPMVAGIKVFKSNHVKDITVDSTASGYAGDDDGDDGAKNNPFGGTSGYNADLSGLRFLGGHKSSVGTVKLLDIATESEYDIRRQGTILVAKYAMGHNYLRQAACVKVVN